MTSRAPLPVGMPCIPEYERLAASPEFGLVERFSAEFLDRHRAAIRPYARTWVADPLHQWSRRWEYPFVLSRLAADLSGRPDNGPVRILDAGSGVTFLPYFVAESFHEVTVECCDHDGSLVPIFDSINDRRAPGVRFTQADLHDLPFAAGSFDVVCCVSVLEHLDRQETVVEEFRRVLRPGGRLVLTFDLPLPVDEDEYGPALDVLAAGFCPDPGDPPDIRPRPTRTDEELVTTTYAAGVDRALLPWRHPWLHRLSCLVAGHGWVEWPPPMTVACLSLTRRP